MYGRAKCMMRVKAHRIGRIAATDRTSQPAAPDVSAAARSSPLRALVGIHRHASAPGVGRRVTVWARL